MHCSTPGFPVHHQLPEFTQTHVHWVGDAIQPSHPLSFPSLPTFNLSQHQGLFKWVSSSIRWPKYWSFHFSISPSNEYSGLTSFRMDWLVGSPCYPNKYKKTINGVEKEADQLETLESKEGNASKFPGFDFASSRRSSVSPSVVSNSLGPCGL